MKIYIPTKVELEETIRKTVRETIQESLPGVIRKATRKKWLKSSDVMEILQCSRPHLQYLRDSGQIPFHQHNRSIRYDIDEVEEFLNRGRLNRRDSTHSP